MTENKPTIGFIGQGFIGKNYADVIEERGYSVVRYAREEPYNQNKERIAECDIVFIAVPTPTTPEGFDASIVREVLSFVGEGKTAVIKSTILPGTTEKLQAEFPGIYLMHSPEFLSEATAAHDAANPSRNIVGTFLEREGYEERARKALEVFPDAPFELVCSAREAEYIKYGGNNWFYFKIVFINMLYDLVQKDGCDWETIRDAMAADPRIGSTHLNPVHKSGTKGGDASTTLSFNELHLEPKNKGGRGAGGHCFIKDFAAFADLYENVFPEDAEGNAVLRALELKNKELLTESGKDIDLLEGVYGKKGESNQQ